MLIRHETAVVPAALVLFVVSMLLGGCGSSAKRPVLYPNATLNQMGQAQAQLDIDHCMAMADSHNVARTRDGDVGGKAASGALIGGASAGAWGLVRGDAGDRALAGALAGGTAGAVKGGVDSQRMSPVYQRFVQQCLKDLGYQVIGWQ